MTSPDVQYATVGSVELAYTTAGDETSPPVLLVAGLGMQLIGWEDDFCAELVDRGLRVIRYDNRDAGLSTSVSEVSGEQTAGPIPGLPAPAYALDDLAADAAGVLDALGLESAHVVGISMGGMIVQLLAITHPDRVRSLTSIMSTTGDPAVGGASEQAAAMLMGPPPSDREQVLDAAVVSERIIGSPGYPRTVEELRERAGRAYDRAFNPAGTGRQLLACLTAWDRTERLRGVRVPTLVIHGAEDTLIDVSGGRATADAVPDAELLVLDGMGHDLPRALWGEVADRIAGVVKRAEDSRPH